MPSAGAPPLPPLTANQIRSFLAAWGGWALDGMDSFIYALVLIPALKDLLPHSGIPGTPANIGFYGGLLFAMFLVGWGLAFLWGPVGDRFGRVRTLTLTILCYSLFTFLGAVSTSVWQLGTFRLLAGFGIGGEWTLGGVLIAEAWPEARRKTGAGWMHTGYYFGVFLAAIANAFIGAAFGWRAMFVLGGAPALLVSYIRRGVHEPARWTGQGAVRDSGAFGAPLKELFSPAAPPHHPEFHLSAHLDDGSLGGLGLCAVLGDSDRHACRAQCRRGRAPGFLCHHAAFGLHHPGMPHHGAAGRADRAPRDARLLFRADVPRYRLRIRLCLLS